MKPRFPRLYLGLLALASVGSVHASPTAGIDAAETALAGVAAAIAAAIAIPIGVRVAFKGIDLGKRLVGKI